MVHFSLITTKKGSQND